MTVAWLRLRASRHLLRRGPGAGGPGGGRAGCWGCPQPCPRGRAQCLPSQSPGSARGVPRGWCPALAWPCRRAPTEAAGAQRGPPHPSPPFPVTLGPRTGGGLRGHCAPCPHRLPIAGKTPPALRRCWQGLGGPPTHRGQQGHLGGATRPPPPGRGSVCDPARAARRGGFVLRLSRAAWGRRRANPARWLCLGTVVAEGRRDPGHPLGLAQVGSPRPHLPAPPVALPHRGRAGDILGWGQEAPVPAGTPGWGWQGAGVAAPGSRLGWEGWGHRPP